MSRRRVSHYKREYLYVHEYYCIMTNKTPIDMVLWTLLNSLDHRKCGKVMIQIHILYVTEVAVLLNNPIEFYYIIWAVAWDFPHCGMCDQQRLRPACAYAQSDQNLCLSLDYSMTVNTPIPHRPRIDFFIDSRGFVRFHYFFLQSSCSTSQSRFRYDFVTIIPGNRLKSRKNSLRLAN